MFHVSAPDVLAANDLPANSAIEEGDELVIPVAGSSGGGSNALQYTPRRGDTLVTVADRFNVTAENLRSWNRMKSSVLTPGKKIYVAEPVRLAPASRGRRRAASSKASSAKGSKASRGKSAATANGKKKRK